MDELTRFARALVERLEARPEGLERPVSVAVLRTELMPYRRERRALGFSSVEDYETVLLRLVAEERGLVRTSPAAAAERCREVLSQPNPDLGILEEIADSLIHVTSLASASASTEAPSAERRAPSAEPRVCRHCQGALPASRAATFCPWCGKRLVPLLCSRCGTEFESGWRHCITCGAPVSDPYPASARSQP
ncbi:MAG: zinc ribbon domain-containing protein [Gemmatimonadales bacterium]